MADAAKELNWVCLLTLAVVWVPANFDNTKKVNVSTSEVCNLVCRLAAKFTQFYQQDKIAVYRGQRGVFLK